MSSIPKSQHPSPVGNSGSGSGSDDKDLVYDRQVRLWGAAAQLRLSSSTVLVTGCLTMLGSECVKNLVLAGLNLAIHDNVVVDEERMKSGNLFLRTEDKGKTTAEACVPRIKDMNPLARVTAVKDIGNIKDYALVLVIDMSFTAAQEMELKCVQNKIPFMMASSAGMMGYTMLNLGTQWMFSIERKIDDVSSTSSETSSYVSLKNALDTSLFNKMCTGGRKNRMPDLFFALCAIKANEGHHAQDADNSTKRARMSHDQGWEEHVRNLFVGNRGKPIFVQNGRDEMTFVKEVAQLCVDLESAQQFSPVCTILGGLVGNEAIKIVTGKEEPVNNILFVDGNDGSAVIRKVVGE